MYTRCILLCLLTILSSIYIFGGNYSKNFIRFDYPDTYVVDAEQTGGCGDVALRAEVHVVGADERSLHAEAFH